MGWLQDLNNARKKLTNVVDQGITALPLNKQQATDAAALAALAAGGMYAAPYLTGAGTAGAAGTAGTAGATGGVLGDLAATAAAADQFITGLPGTKSQAQSLLGQTASVAAPLIAGQQGANAAGDALAEARRQFDINQANMRPWLTAGQGALAEQQALMGLGGDSSNALASLVNSPGYQFRMTQGQRALDASSAARGGMGSGKAMTSAQKWGQEFASNEYTNRLNQLAGLSGTGQAQSSALGALGQQYGSEAGNAALTAAAARQSGILGAGKAVTDWMNPTPKQPTLADILAGRY